MMCAAEAPPNRKFSAPLRAVTFLGCIYRHGATGLTVAWPLDRPPQDRRNQCRYDDRCHAFLWNLGSIPTGKKAV